MSAPLFAGIDLAWSTGWTGLAATDDEGRLVASARVKSEDEIEAWVKNLGGRARVVAVDAPLIVPNATGQRAAERLIGQTFGAFGASAHTSNKATFAGEEPRAMQLASRSGWTVDPSALTGGDTTVCIEVYPHPAMVGLFELGYRIAYKKGKPPSRREGFVELARQIERIPELCLEKSARWAELQATVSAPRRGDLNRVEDELDAILCAHLAWLWHHKRSALRVYGSLEEGYIVAPPPPSHRPVRPQRLAGTPAGRS